MFPSPVEIGKVSKAASTFHSSLPTHRLATRQEGRMEKRGWLLGHVLLSLGNRSQLSLP